MLRASLRLKYTLLVNGLIVVPMAVYLIWDIQLERRQILDSRLEVLRSVGQLVVEQAAVDAAAGYVTTQRQLDRFHAEQPHLEIYVLDAELRTTASTHAEPLVLGESEAELRDVVAGQTGFVWELDQHGDLPVLEISLPVVMGVPGGEATVVGAVHIAEPQATVQRAIRQSRTRSTTFVLLLMVLTGTTITLATNRMIIRRIGRLTRRMQATRWRPVPAADRVERDELDTLARVLDALMAEVERATDELREALSEREALLGRVEGFNEELTAQVAATRRELEAVQGELLRKERLSAIGELTAGLAHEIRNPLQIIQGTAEMVRRKHPESREALGDVVDEVVRLNQLVHALLDYARPLEPACEEVPLAPLVESALAELQTLPGGVEVVQVIPDGFALWGDEGLLRRVLVNLLSNAAEALGGEGGTVHVRAASRGDGGARVRVEDDGPGIDAEDLAQVFTPFFSRKEAGTGLGLCLSRRFAELHGGTLALHSEPGEGTAAVLELPPREETT